MILRGENMIQTTAMLLEKYNEYSNPKTKLGRMVKKGKYIKIARGLYETDKNIPGYVLAGSIYGPSYISFDFALGYYGLIPERVNIITSATFDKKKNKSYKNSYGIFTYRDVPSEVFPYGIRLNKYKDYFFRIAEPEKAICDKLYTISPVVSQKDLEDLLIKDLRIEVSELDKLDIQKLEFLSKKYHSTNISKFYRFMRRFKK